jgi:hypothetical protein
LSDQTFVWVNDCFFFNAKWVIFSYIVARTRLFAIYWNIKRSYTLLSTIYCIGDFKIVSISVFVLANFFIFLFLLFYLSVFLYLVLPHFSKISSYAATVFICMLINIHVFQQKSFINGKIAKVMCNIDLTNRSGKIARYTI